MTKRATPSNAFVGGKFWRAVLPTLRLPDGLHARRNTAAVEVQRLPAQVLPPVRNSLSLPASWRFAITSP
jgi:hypothetical protein